VLLACALPGLGGCTAEAPPLRSIALITIDTLRADHVSAYGFPHATTAAIDALAAHGALFERTIAAASSTIPSHAAMMTSHFPRRTSAGARNGDTRLEGLETLADRFSQGGWTTAAFVSNAVLQRRSGLDRGFSHYDDHLGASEGRRVLFERVADDTAAATIAWLDAHPDSRVFVWVHLQDPHGPYTPPEAWLERVPPWRPPRDPALEVATSDVVRGRIPAYQFLKGLHRFSQYARRYAAEAVYADSGVARIVRALRARGPTAVVLTSDHGESLGENGYFFQHGHASTPDLALVPLLIAAPGVVPTRRGGLASHVDIAPTLLELADLPPLADAAGLELAPYLRSATPLPAGRAVFCDSVGESMLYLRDAALRVRGFGRRSAARALARFEAGDTSALQFEGSIEQPGGVRAAIDPALDAQMRAYLRGEVPLAPSSPNPETRERLRALGYLGEVDGS